MRLAVLSLPFKERLPGLRNRSFRLRVRTGDIDRTIVLKDRVDFTLVDDILVRGEYDVPLPEPPRAILDLGAHVGLSALYFRGRFPSATILAVEPNPITFARLSENLGGLPNIGLVNAAVGGHTGTAWLDVGQDSWRTMLVGEQAGSSTIPVSVSTLDDLVQQAGFEPRHTLIKIDVEGAEWEALSSASDLSSYLGIIGDLHRDLLPVPAVRFFELFDGLHVVGREEPSFFAAVRGSD
jgi:FkbM family methyltransferase